MQNNLKFFLWSFILCVLPFFNSKVCKVFAYNIIESAQEYNKVKQYINDDTLILIPPSLTTTNTNNTNQSITLLFSNGTSSNIIIDLKSRNDKNTLIEIYPLMINYIWILYARRLNENNNDQNMFGMLMNWNGEILSYDVNLNCPYITNDLPAVATNINLSGFIAISKNVNHQLTWNEYLFSKVADQPEMISIILSSHGTFEYQNQTELIDYSILGTIEGTYGILILLQNLDIKNVNLTTSYQAQPIYMAYLTFIRTNTVQILQRPTLIYEISELQITWIHIQSCKVGFVDHANICFIKFIVNRAGLFLSAIVKISFLSSGSVFEIKQLGLDYNSTVLEPAIPNNINIVNITDSVIPLKYDGLLLIRHSRNFLNGHIHDQNDNSIGKVWDIPESLTANNRLLEFGVFENNTAWIALDLATNNNNIFRILSSDIPKFAKDNGYNNLLVTLTGPKINDTLFTPYPDKINVTYSIPITSGPGNITIYQNDEENKSNIIIRQTFPGNSKYCKIDGNLRITISCDVLQSTFNRLNTTYMIVVDSNFVKNSLLSEPLLGIPNGFWTFKTNESSNDVNTPTDKVSVILRLDDEGTKLFSKEEEFLDNLNKELSEIIPIESNRLSFTGLSQKDTSSPSGRLLIELNISGEEILTEPSSLRILENLKTLITNKDITMISFLNHTRFLDETYDVHIIPNLWEQKDVKYLFFVFLLICILLGSLYLWARYRHPEGHNSAIFKVPLVLIDLIMDILFLVFNGRTIHYLFVPSVVILSISLALNSFLSIIIITHEISHNNEFRKWFNNHTKLTALFTVLSSADVEELNILKSKIAGLETFSAPYSQVGLSWILAGSALNVLTTDLPQVIIQIIYSQAVINYTVVPFFTLVTSNLIFVIDLISHVYDYMFKDCDTSKIQSRMK